MLDLLKKLFGAEIDPQALKVKEAVELVLDESVPRVRWVRGYKKKMTPAVEKALAHCAELAGQIPGVLDLTGERKSSLSILKGFLANEQQAPCIIKQSGELKEFLTNEESDELYILLTMVRQVKTAYGSKLQGNMLVRDVAQKAYLFEDHQLILPSRTVDEAFNAIQLGLLKVLAHHALELILAEQGRESELEHLRDELEVKLKIMRTERRGMVLEWNDPKKREVYTNSQKLLEEIETELNQVRTQSEQGDYYLDRLLDVLDNPEQYLSVELIPMQVDRLGIFVGSESCDNKDGMCVAEFKLGENDRRSAVLIKCLREEVLELAQKVY